MDLAAALSALEHEPRKVGPLCSVCRAIQELPENDAVALLAALNSAKVSARRISETMSEAGTYLSAKMIGWHRAGKCRAGRG